MVFSISFRRSAQPNDQTLGTDIFDMCSATDLAGPDGFSAGGTTHLSRTYLLRAHVKGLRDIIGT
jgi:hypothetical protein